MKKILHPQNERGIGEFGWLHTRYSFSFNRWYNPEKMGFGLLRVLNDDTIEAGEGFGTHPHDNMEIVTIILEGELEHKDSMGNGSVIRKGEIQAMSAGTGITHSEFNHSSEKSCSLFQLWIFPKEENISPRYDQMSLPLKEQLGKIIMVASGDKNSNTVYIHQDAAISIGNLTAGGNLEYKVKWTGNGVFIFVIEGSIEAADETLHSRDAVGIYETDSILINAPKDSSFLLIEVPMN